MKLHELLDGLHGHVVVGDTDVEVGAVRSDSREIRPGDVFVAVRGLRSDGHAFVQVALDRGAAAIVVEREVVAGAAAVVTVPSSAEALGVLIGNALQNPARTMTLVGITGTNGKTTTTYLVESILRAAGHEPGVIGTVTYRWKGHSIDAPYTTPTPQVLHETFARMRADGVTHVVMEVSSAALAMHRLAGVTFQIAAFSNLTQDHLDVHGSMTEYFEAKKLLFTHHLGPGGPGESGGAAVVNVDDPKGQAMGAAYDGRVLRVTARPAGDGTIRVVEQTSTVRGIEAKIATPRGEIAVSAKPLIGHYNVENLALAVGIGEALGLSHAVIAKGIAELSGVPGRVERVASSADLDVFVDYAHTPDALRNVLQALRPLTARRLICVFGCGGDRDPSKRPKMGAAVAELADLAVVTSDNPRTEDPRAIIDQILPGVPRPFLVEVDRRAAIKAAIAEAVPGDVVVIAGKGHEDYQIIGTTKHHFDDREVATEAITEREVRFLPGLARDAGSTTIVKDLPVSRVVIDSRKALPGSLYVAIKGETHDGHAFCAKAVETGAVAVMVERAVDVGVPQIVVEDTRIALGKIARAHRRAWPGKLVAITGSAGKTTTKELTRAALAADGPTLAAEGSLNNETGLPLTVLGLRLLHTYGVVEMGMRGAGQIEYLTKIAEPDVAVVVNAGTAHIELLGSTDAIAKAKAEIWMGLREGGTVVLPANDLRLEAHARAHRPKARHVTFGEVDADVRLVEYTPLVAPDAQTPGSQLVLDVFGTRHDLTLQLVGRHSAIDACAAIAAAHAAGASIATILAGLSRAKPPSMRGEVVEVGGRKVIVDCYNANPASMAAALRSLAERASGRTAIAVLGDMLELGEHAKAEHEKIGALARELGVGVVTLGEHAKLIAGEHASDPLDAATRTLARTKAGDWIMLKASRGMKLERVLDAMREAKT